MIVYRAGLQLGMGKICVIFEWVAMFKRMSKQTADAALSVIPDTHEVGPLGRL